MTDQNFRVALKKIQDKHADSFNARTTTEQNLVRDEEVIVLAEKMKMDPWHLVEEMVANLRLAQNGRRSSDK